MQARKRINCCAESAGVMLDNSRGQIVSLPLGWGRWGGGGDRVAAGQALRRLLQVKHVRVYRTQQILRYRVQVRAGQEAAGHGWRDLQQFKEGRHQQVLNGQHQVRHLKVRCFKGHSCQERCV